MLILKREFRQWDRPSQIGFITGLLLFVLLLVIAFSLPFENRAAALAAAGGVWLVTQMVVLWANRGMVTPYTRAQRLYLKEDFEGVVKELEQLRSSGKADEKALTLLGNTYRQLGKLNESEEALRLALQIAPNHHFPLYGFGRTLLVKGDYAEAVKAIEAALQAGAPPALYADLGEAQYYAGLNAVETLRAVLPYVENDLQRQLMVRHLLHKLEDGYSEPDDRLIHAGIDYWQATAERFQATPYGIRLMNEVSALKQRIGEV